MKTFKLLATLFLATIACAALNAQCFCTESQEVPLGYTNFRCDDFSSYNWNVSVIDQSSLWRQYPGNTGEAYVRSNHHFGTVLEIDHENDSDVLFDLGQKSKRDLRISWNMNIHEQAYYGFHDSKSGDSWVFHVYFQDGEGKVFKGNTEIGSFTYPKDRNFNVAHIYNSHSDNIQLWIDNTYVTDWTYSYGSRNTFGSINFFAWEQSYFTITSICAFEDTWKPLVDCAQNYDPVCVNQTEYENECLASYNGYTSNEWSEGPCQGNGGGDDLCENISVIYQEDFDQLERRYIAQSQPQWWQEGDRLPEIFPNILDCLVFENHGNNTPGLVFITETANTDVEFKMGELAGDTYYLSYDLTTENFNHRIKNGQIYLNADYSGHLLDISSYSLYMAWGSEDNGNEYASLWFVTEGLIGPTQTKITDLPILYSKNDNYPMYKIEWVIDRRNESIQLYIDGEFQKEHIYNDPFTSSRKFTCEFISESGSEYSTGTFKIDNFLFAECNSKQYNYDPIEIDIGEAPCGDPTDIVRIPIKVSNFEDISSFQFKVELTNPNAGIIESVEGIDIASSSMITTRLNATTAIFGWSSNTESSLNDQTTIAHINVRLSSNHNTSSNLIITDSQPEVVFQQGGQLVDAETYGGSFSVCKPSNIHLCGTVLRSDDVGIAYANVTATNITTGESKTVSTDNEGKYCFDDLPANQEYKIAIEKDYNYMNGVNGRDGFFITRHALYIQRFNDPFKTIAADLDNDEIIVMADVSELLRAQTTPGRGFPKNKSWRFVDAQHNFVNSNDPFNPEFPETIQVNAGTQDISSVDFIGIKIGDVTLDNDPVQIIGSQTDLRNSTSITLTTLEPYKRNDGRYAMPVVLTDITDVDELINLEFSLSWTENTSDFSGLQLENSDIDLSMDNFYISNANQDTISMVWFDQTGLGVSTSDTLRLFEVVFESSQNNTFEIDVEFGNEPVEIAAGSLLEVLDVLTVSGSYKLTTSTQYQTRDVSVDIFPNPFTDRVTVNLSDKMGNLTRAELISMQGQVIFSEILSDSQSYLEWNLEEKAPGTYLIKLIGEEIMTTQTIIKK